MPSCDGFYSLPQVVPLVNNFFQIFQSFLLPCVPSRDSSSILPQSISLVNKFFRFSQNFFLATASLSRQLCYINTLTTVCQTFFRSFFRFFPLLSFYIKEHESSILPIWKTYMKQGRSNTRIPLQLHTFRKSSENAPTLWYGKLISENDRIYRFTCVGSTEFLPVPIFQATFCVLLPLHSALQLASTCQMPSMKFIKVPFTTLPPRNVFEQMMLSAIYSAAAVFSYSILLKKPFPLKYAVRLCVPWISPHWKKASKDQKKPSLKTSV